MERRLTYTLGALAIALVVLRLQQQKQKTAAEIIEDAKRDLEPLREPIFKP